MSSLLDWLSRPVANIAPRKDIVVPCAADNDWNRIALRLATSRNVFERNHFFLGLHRECLYPVFAHRPLFIGNGHIIGPTGAGKTTLGVIPLLRQIIMRRDSGVVIVDLKGDKAMFEDARLAARDFGLVFKYFTNELGYSTFTFNPLPETNSNVISASQFVETLMQALGLEYGHFYGGRFFSSQSREWLLDCIKRNPEIQSFEELSAKTTSEHFDRLVDRDRVKEAIAVLQQLAEVQALNWRNDPARPKAVGERAIRMRDVVEQNHITYFWLPAIGETATVTEIANLVVYALLTAAKLYQRENGKPKETFLFIDEFQRMATRAFSLVLTQARSLGVRAILSNQTLSDLKTKDAPELLNSVLNNTAFRQFFAPADPAVETFLIEQSGESEYVDGYTFSPDSELWEPSPRTRKGPRHGRNDVKAYASERNTSIVQFNRDSGLTCYGGRWFAIHSPFHIDERTYEQRLDSPWPEGEEGTIVATRPALPPLPQKGTIEAARLLGPTAPALPAPTPAPETTDPQVGPETPAPLLTACERKPDEWSARLKEAWERRMTGFASDLIQESHQ